MLLILSYGKSRGFQLLMGTRCWAAPVNPYRYLP